MPVGQKIRRRRKELGLTQGELAKAVGVVTQTISQVEMGKMNLSPDRYPALAKALKVPVAFFDVRPDPAPKSEVMEIAREILDAIRDLQAEAEEGRALKASLAGEKRPRMNIEPFPDVPGAKTRLVPLYCSVAAGSPNGLKNGISAPEEYISIGDDVLSAWPDAFAFRVKGDSMEPEAHENDLVICSREAVPRPGDIVVADVRDEWLLKRLEGNGIEAVLYPVNSRHKPVPIRENSDIRLVKVLALVRKYD